MSVSLRLMRFTDLEAVHAVQIATFAPALHEALSLFERVFSASPESCFVAQDAQGPIAGYLLSYPSLLDRSDFEHGPRSPTGRECALYIHDLCVGSAFQKTGLGKRLLERAKTFAAGADLPVLCGIAVAHAAPFWKRQGFDMNRKCTYHDTPATYMTLNLNHSRD